MTYLLVLHMFMTDGETVQYNMAIFTDKEDCQLAGNLVARELSMNNNVGAVVRYTCDPVV